VIERFPERVEAGYGFDRPQVVGRAVGHQIRHEPPRIGQGLSGRLEPDHALGHGQQCRGFGQRVHGAGPSSGRLA
jgi:hypothetical protein